MVWLWCGFFAFVSLLLILDLGVFHRRAKAVAFREALAWSAFWMALGLSFAVFVYFAYDRHWGGLGALPDAADRQHNDGHTAALKYLTGYIVEQSLSVDNLFVIALILGFFRVPPKYQRRVLFWGILGAFLMRGAVIFLGAQLIVKFHWILYLFALFLIVTGVKMLIWGDKPADPSASWVVRATRRLFPVSDRFYGERFLIRAGSVPLEFLEADGGEAGPDLALERARPGALLMTPLLLALIVVDVVDLVFAVDSIPAIFAITADPFLVYTSNVFAVLGLRALYFALAGMLGMFRFLSVSLALILILVGAKMLAASQLKEMLGRSFNYILLGLVLIILLGGMLASLIAGPEERKGGGTGGQP